MPPGDAYEATPARFFFELNGYQERNQRQWEHTRLIVGALTGKNPKEIIKLKFDAPTVKVAPDELREWGANMANLMGWNNKEAKA